MRAMDIVRKLVKHRPDKRALKIDEGVLVVRWSQPDKDLLSAIDIHP